jgi:tRNA (cytidine/uridine-2'-O-)-methyltransferase
MTDREKFHIVLVEPEIPQNTGSIARLCGATNTVLHLVHPLGFSTDNKYLKRAGLDYWKFVDIRYWDSLDHFLTAHGENRLYFFTTKTNRSYVDAPFTPGDYLLFGKETRGLPEAILRRYENRCYTLPMANPNIRSLNLAMTAGIVLYEALRKN